MMGLLDAYQESTDTALNVMASMPLEIEKPAPKNSAWSAPFRAVASGAAEVAGNVIDTASAFGQVTASAGGITPGFDPDAKKNRQATVDAYDKLKTDGIDWRTDEAKQAYKFGADLRPDPLTAGTAENIVFGLTKGLTKAIGAAVTLGPVGGAAAFGVSEGMTASEDLATQGVDQATRTKVGAVTGVMSAASVALPVAGKTLAQTAGLVVAGGPLSFMAQQQATRSILENANYGEIAKQYDPLDPVGLTIATLLPAGFAAYAKRGGFAAKPAPVAEGQPIADSTPATQGDSVAATSEAIDAAMVQNLTAARDAHQDTPPAKIEAEMWRGPVTENPNFKAWFGDSKVVRDDGSPMVVYHGTDKDISEFKNDYSVNKLDAGARGSGFYFTKHAEEAEKYSRLRNGWNLDGDVIYPVFIKIENPFYYKDNSEIVPEHVRKIINEEYEPIAKIEEERNRKAINETRDILGLPLVDEVTPEPLLDSKSTFSDLVFRTKESSSALTSAIIKLGHDGVIFNDGIEIVVFDQAQIKSAIGNSGKFDPNSPSLTDPTAKDSSVVQPDSAVVRENQTTETPDAYRVRVETLAKEQPDLIYRLDEAGQPVKLSDDLAAIKKQAQEGTDTDFGAMDAPLLKVAVECALSIGTAAL